MRLRLRNLAKVTQPGSHRAQVSGFAMCQACSRPVSAFAASMALFEEQRNWLKGGSAGARELSGDWLTLSRPLVLPSRVQSHSSSWLWIKTGERAWLQGPLTEPNPGLLLLVGSRWTWGTGAEGAWRESAPKALKNIVHRFKKMVLVKWFCSF